MTFVGIIPKYIPDELSEFLPKYFLIYLQKYAYFFLHSGKTFS